MVEEMCVFFSFLYMLATVPDIPSLFFFSSHEP